MSLTNVSPGAHTYAVAASNIWGEGELGEPLTTPGKPSKPGALKLKTVRLVMESSPDMETWTALAAVDVPASESRQFFRAVFDTP
jgi:hypothetical protein